jgi:hypothetical protein
MIYCRLVSLIQRLLVLRVLCRRPDGMMWVGDTAQTIAAGSSFRFSELKAFNYRLEVSFHVSYISITDPCSV